MQVNLPNPLSSKNHPYISGAPMATLISSMSRRAPVNQQPATPHQGLHMSSPPAISSTAVLENSIELRHHLPWWAVEFSCLSMADHTWQAKHDVASTLHKPTRKNSKLEFISLSLRNIRRNSLMFSTNAVSV